jgi:hypothetical protein
VSLDDIDNGCYMTVNSKQLLLLKMSCLDNSNNRLFTAVISNGREYSKKLYYCAVIEKCPASKYALNLPVLIEEPSSIYLVIVPIDFLEMNSSEYW